MIRIKMIRKRITLVIFVLVLLTSSSFANSGPVFWSGYPSYESLLVEEDTPIEVIREDLTFDFTREEFEEYNDYSKMAQVRADYTMVNTSGASRRVEMAFPFISYIKNFNPKDIKILMDKKEIPFEIFIGDEYGPRSKIKTKEEDFEFILSDLTRTKYPPKNYNLQDRGTLYTYDIDTKANEELNIKITSQYDHEKSKVISKGFNGYEENDGRESLTAWIRDREEVEIFVLGQDVDFDLVAYKDGEAENEVDNYNLDIRTEVLSLGDYLAREMDVVNKEYDYLNLVADNQFSNIIKKELDQQIEKNVVNLSVEGLFSLDYVERYFVLVYGVDFQPNSKDELSITYKSLGTMDRTQTAQPIYSFDYILNPASNWASFKDLNIEIIPPEDHPYIIDSSLELIRSEEGRYLGSYEELPDQDLTFSLYYREGITLIDRVKGLFRSRYYFIMSLLPGVFGLIIGFIYRAFRQKKKTRDKN